MNGFALLRDIIIWDVRLFLFGLLALVAAFLLQGRINTSGLLYGRDPRGVLVLSPARVQLLLVTLALACQYVSEVIAGGRTTLPDIPNSWLVILGGSHGIYLGGKLQNNNRKKKS